MRPTGGGYGGGGGGPKAPLKKETLKRVAKHFDPYRPQMVAVVALVLATAFLGMLNPLFLKEIVNEGLLKKDLGVVAKFSVFALIATLGSTGLSIVFGWISIVVGQKIMRDLRVQLFTHLQGMSLRFFSGTRTGEIQSRLANDVGGIQSVVSDTVANILSNLATVLSTLVAMIWLDWRLTILAVGILPIFSWISSLVGEKSRKIRTEVQAELATLNSTMNETLSVSGALLTKVSGRGLRSVARFQKENESLTIKNIHLATVMRVFFNMIGVAFSVTPVLVYWLAGYLVVANQDTNLTLGTIVAFTSLQPRLFFPLTGLLNTQVELTSSMALFDRIYEYLDMKQEITDKPGAVALDAAHAEGRVRFENVSFRYEETQESLTLEGINLEAQPGQLVALVGPSGAGKTTLTYLIPRLYDVESGRVMIDGQDVRDVTLASLAGVVGVVTQETYLVNDTIRENLRYGRPDATDDELIAACQAASIHDHIASLPEGYDTVVGERGYKLSGGEKQRIAIARAILQDPRILILDEATSALDTESERRIQTALDSLMVGRTTFAVAHRLSTIVSADQILVMVEGKIVERGKHQELLAHDGEYARLYRMQFADETPVTA